MKKILLFFLVLSNICFGQTDIKKGLRAYYPFNGSAADESGNNNNPVFNNATLTKDRFGKPNGAYHFNGINNYMRIPNNPLLNMSDKITLSVWIRPTGFYHAVCHASSIISKGQGNYQPGDYALRFDDALYTAGTGCSDSLSDTLHQNFRGTGTTLKTYLPYVSKDQWYVVTYTNDGTTAKLYVDCDLKYSVEYQENFTNNEDLFIGKTNDIFFNFWLNADLDDVRIYDRALTPEEVGLICGRKINDTITKVPPPPPEVKLEPRTKETMRQITVDHDSVTVTLYDNGEIDGDSITLIYNDSVLATHKKLTNQPLTFTIKIAPGSSRNELVMYAENLGSIPPNTALMVIYDGDKRYEVSVRSSLNTSGAVSFKLRE